MKLQILAIGISVALFVFVLELVRRRRLTFKYAFGWLFACALAVVFSFFHEILFNFATLLGFELPSNFIFFSLFCVFIVLSLLLTVFLCQINSRNDRLAQRMALLELELNKNKNIKDRS